MRKEGKRKKQPKLKVKNSIVERESALQSCQVLKALIFPSQNAKERKKEEYPKGAGDGTRI